jgi:hypothetical protein
METQTIDGSQIVVKLTLSEVDALGSAINEAIGCVERRDFHLRVGMSREDAESLLKHLRQVRSQMMKKG